MSAKWFDNTILKNLRQLRKTNKKAYYEELNKLKDQVSHGAKGFYLKFPKTESLGHMNWVLRQEGFNKGKISKDSLFPIDYEKIAYNVTTKEAIEKKKKILQQRLKPEEYQRFVKRIDEKYEKFNKEISKSNYTTPKLETLKQETIKQLNNIKKDSGKSSGGSGSSGGGGGGSLGGLITAGVGAATVLSGGVIYLASNRRKNLEIKNKDNSKEQNNEKYIKLKKEKK